MAEGFPALVIGDGELLEDEIEVLFQFEGGSTDSSVHGIRGAISIFVEAGMSGAFPSLRASPHQSQLTLLNGPQRSDDTVKVLLKCVNIDPRCFHLLRNMISRLVFEGLLVRQITVRAVSTQEVVTTQAPIPDVYNMYQVYPEPSRQLTFPTEWLGTSFSKSRRCLVECARSIEPKEVSNVCAKVQTWGHLLEAGAFAMPVGFPDEVEVVGINASQFDDVTIEVVVSHFKASEAAWCVLLHILDVISRQSIPIVKAIVE